MSNPINERNTKEFFEKLQAEQPLPDHASQFELTERVTPSGKVLHKCLVCGFETPFPTLECLWSREELAERLKHFKAIIWGGGCGNAE